MIHNFFRKKLDLIGLHPGGGKTVAPGPALVHAGGNAGLVHGDACRHAVQHRADGGTVALAENGQRQRAAVSVFHGLIPPCPAGSAGPLPGWSRPASSQGRGFSDLTIYFYKQKKAQLISV